MTRVNEISGKGQVVSQQFNSVEELADYSKRFVEERYYGGLREQLGRNDFYGEDCPTPGAAYAMAREGWKRHLDATLDIARGAVTDVEANTDVPVFEPVWDVQGSIVDMGAYLAGEPECMIEYPPARAPRNGRVITLCASISHSCAISAGQLIQRGKVVTALAMELERLGLNTELYADFAVSGKARSQGKRLHARTLVKGPNDTLDPARILFAYAHPGMLRVLALTSMHGLPQEFRTALSVPGYYGVPAAPPEDLPEGTIYLPEVLSGTDKDCAEHVLSYMRKLGIIDE